MSRSTMAKNRDDLDLHDRFDEWSDTEKINYLTNVARRELIIELVAERADLGDHGEPYLWKEDLAKLYVALGG